MRRLHIASGSAGKVRELQQMLGPLGFEIHLAPPDFAVEEDAPSFAGNALKKAQALQAQLPCDENAWVLADDSGLEVDALGGAPGIYSARYAPGVFATTELRDAANCQALLDALKETPARARGARFVCVLALLVPNEPPAFFEGTVCGTIAHAPAGKQGFGYDCLFLPENQAQTFAQMPPHEKNLYSHRARALARLLSHVARPQ